MSDTQTPDWDPVNEYEPQSPMDHVQNSFFRSIALVNPKIAQVFQNSFVRFQNDIQDPQKKQGLEEKMKTYEINGAEDLEAKMQLHSLERMFKLHLSGLNKNIEAAVASEMETSFMLFHIEKVIDDCNIDADLGILFNELAIKLIDGEKDLDSVLQNLEETIVNRNSKLPKDLDIVNAMQFLVDEYFEGDDPEIKSFLENPVLFMLKVNLKTVHACAQKIDQLVLENDQLKGIGEYAKNGLKLRYESELEKYKTTSQGKSFSVQDLVRIRKDSILVKYAFGYQALVVASKDPNFARELNENPSLRGLCDLGAEVIGGDNDLGSVLAQGKRLEDLISKLMEDNETAQEFFKRILGSDNNFLDDFPTIKKDLMQEETNMLLSAALIPGLTNKQSLIKTLRFLVNHYQDVENSFRHGLQNANQVPYLRNLLNLFCAMNRTMYRQGVDYDNMGNDPQFYARVADNFFFDDWNLSRQLRLKSIKDSLEGTIKSGINGLRKRFKR